jgi:hypothetical protein
MSAARGNGNDVWANPSVLSFVEGSAPQGPGPTIPTRRMTGPSRTCSARALAARAGRRRRSRSRRQEEAEWNASTTKAC